MIGEWVGEWMEQKVSGQKDSEAGVAFILRRATVTF